MPTVRHPRALEDVRGHPPSVVTVNGDNYAVEDGTVTLPDESLVRALAQAYDLDADDLRETATCEVVKSDGDVCGRELPCPYHSDE